MHGNYGNYCFSCGFSRRNPDDDDRKANEALDQSAFSIDITFNMGMEVIVGDDGVERTTPTMDMGIEVSNVVGPGCQGIIDDLLEGIGIVIDSQPKPEMFEVPEEVELEEEYEPEVAPRPQSPFTQSPAAKKKAEGRRKGRAQGERSKESDRQTEQQRRRRRNPVISCSNCGHKVDGPTCWNCGWDLY